MLLRRLLLAAVLSVAASAAVAEVKLDGWFIASETCPAVQSIKTQANPGDIHVNPGRAYEITAGNQADATHYFIRIPGVRPDRRWVAVECGQRTVTPEAGVTADRPAETKPVEKKAPSKPQELPRPATLRTDYVLAINWQPAFCENYSRKAECRTQTGDRFDANSFTLHGLWPQPRDNEYCNVSARDRASSEAGGRAWLELPEVDLPADLRAELDRIMPGTQSGLERHEWTKHGTCFEGGAEAYYRASAAMLQAVNASAVRELFARNIGKRITEQQVREAFNTAFGREAGQRVRMSCALDQDSGRVLVVELTIGLGGELGGPEDLARAISWARPARSDCKEGLIDRVGLQ